MKIDSHMHYLLMTPCKDLLDALDQTGCALGGVVAQIHKERATETMDAIHAKYVSGNRLYAFGALNSSLYITRDDMKYKMVEHVKNLMACGCDGIKMIEAKPSERKDWPIPNFDSDEYDAYWAYMEEKQIPIIWHVNDPEEFWSDELCPDWAKRSGWFYGTGEWINNEDQYKQIDNVLRKYKNLKITFAHFYFLSNQLDRLANIFDMCPNVCVDIVPGIELFENLSKNIDKAKEFFTKYQDRIIYGTDISRRPKDIDFEFNLKDSFIRGKLCTDFISKDKVFIKGDEKSLLGKDDLYLNGLNLSKDICDKIFYKNFIRNVGEMKKINLEEVLKELDRERERIKIVSDYFKVKGDYSVNDYCKEFFLNEQNNHAN